MKILRNNIDLAGSVLASYSIVYKSNFISNISSMDDLNEKHLVRVHSFEFYHQQNNLVFVDFVFPNILADLTLDVYLFQCRSIQQYIDNKKAGFLQVKDSEITKLYTLFEKFIYYLFFSDISTPHYSVGAINAQVIYNVFIDSKFYEFNYISYEGLLKMCLSELELRINTEKCYIYKDEIVLNIEIIV